jgi:GntR family transcriptional regulator
MKKDGEMKLINHQNPTPFYEQLKLILRDLILMGTIPPGSQMPTEQSLCEQYHVSRITAGRALNELEREGLVERIQGKGTIVLIQEHNYDNSLKSIKGFSKTMQELGHKTYSKIISIETFRGNATLLSLFHFQLNQDSNFTLIRRLRYVDDIPAEISSTIVKESLGKRMLEFDLTTVSFYSLYEKLTGLQVIRNEASLTPIIATAEMIDLLKVQPGSAHILNRGITYLEGDIPVEFAINISNGSMFHHTTNIYRYFNVPESSSEASIHEISGLDDLIGSIDRR